MKTLAEIEKIKDSGAEISRTLFQPELRSMISRSQACEIGAQLYEAGLTKALELMLERENVAKDALRFINNEVDDSSEDGWINDVALVALEKLK